MSRKKKTQMDVVHPNAAGIDVGSRSHFAAIGQGTDQVKEFGVYSADHQQLIKWFKENNVQQVAMESTGDYWQNLYSDLQAAGFEMTLANGKFTKNIKGKKTDVQDCQWIQKLHTLGLLSGSFLPDQYTEELRTYTRHRTNLLSMAAAASKKMQKNLRLMNLRLDVVVKDVCGLTGMKIIDAICAGETDPSKLASLRHFNCRKSEEEIAMALQSNGRKDYLFALKQEHQMYHELQAKIKQCDEQIKAFFNDYFLDRPELMNMNAPKKPYKRINKNTPKNIDINQVAFQYFGGVDLMSIEGVSHGTVLSIMSEIGPEGFKKFNSAKQFASWLRLSPNNKISGGKILSSKIPRGSNRLKIALRQAANAIGNLKDANLYSFFVRIALRKSRSAAVTATARKLAMIIWNMVTKKEAYNPPTQYEFLDQKRKRLVRQMRKQMVKFDIKTTEIALE